METFGYLWPYLAGFFLELKVKSKGLPRQAEVTQGVSGRLRSRIFLTFRHYKGSRSSAKHTDRLYPRRSPWYSISETESTSGHMVLSGVPLIKSPVTPPGIDPGTSRLVAQCLNQYYYANPKMKSTSDKSCREDQNTQFTFNNCFPQIRAVYEIMWKNNVKPGRTQMTV